ncbi:MAG: carboxypeptidase regulatory-like domain-containing protein [Planctomycetes bacterium]|nr:carboxypeptidase regulatory-like domain-containing protein [Planctomycetota bacterium]
MKAFCLLAVAAAFGAVLPVPLPQASAPAALPAAEPQDPGATLSGSVKIKGDIPKRRKIATNADPKCAAAHPGDSILGDEVVADAAGNTQWGFVYVKEGLGEQKFDAPKTPVVVEQKGCRFEPHVMGVMTGQELMFRNQDPLMHIVHIQPKNNREFGFSQARQGEERAKVFTAKETIRLFCDVHPWMVAWIVVLDHPFYAVTDAAGKYKIKNLPPGKYTIEVWHETYKPVTQEIEIKAKEAKTANFVLTDKQ